MVQEPPIRAILKKIRNYEIRMHKQLLHFTQGDYRSVFKGSGLTFHDVRPYQYGDEVRAINWKLSAKGHGIHLNTFVEEREQHVVLLLDVSGSQEVGRLTQQKIDVGREICGVLTFSAIKYGAHVGLLAFSSEQEMALRPAKGMSHAYRMFHALYGLRPKSSATNLKAFLQHAMQLIKRKSLLLFISDFVDDNYKGSLASLGDKHDVVVVDLVDAGEEKFPRLGVMPLIDKESGRRYWMNTSSRAFRRVIRRELLDKKDALKSYCLRQNISYLRVRTQEDYVPQLAALFRRRNQSAVTRRAAP